MTTFWTVVLVTMVWLFLALVVGLIVGPILRRRRCG
jgi:hypothetical protein